MDTKIIEIKEKKLKIRRLQKEDKEIFWEYFQALSEKTKNFFQPHPFDKETAEKLCNENDPEIVRFIAVEEVNGEEEVIIYAFLSGLSGDFPSLGIGIRDDYQGKGLGRILMEHLVELAKSLGKKGLSLTVFDDNKNAFHLYSKLGFKVERITYTMKLKF